MVGVVDRFARLRAVVQGFGPFGDWDANPAAELALAVADQHCQGVDVVPLVLPVSHAEVQRRVPTELKDREPDIWLGIGLAAERCSVAVEQVAVNAAHYSAAPDVDGLALVSEPVLSDHPAAYLTGLPADDIVGHWRSDGIPGYVSDTAGRYLCNEAFYLASATAEELGLGTAVGFLHVPLLPHMVRRPEREPSMALELMLRAVVICLETTARAIREARAIDEAHAPAP